MSEPSRATPSPLTKLAIEAGPLVLFFVANARAGIYVATGALMLGLVASLAASWRIERRLPVMPLITAVFALIFGGLTIALHDDEFVKMKPTIVDLLLAGALLVGLALGKSPLKVLLNEAFQLDEAGWRKLTLRWAVFFVALAGMNEIFRLGFSTDAWVAFKTFGVLPLTILFMGFQFPLVKRHSLEPAPEPAAGAERSDG